VVIDCANGAAYRTAPEVLWELGASVIPIGVSPNGYNINDGCGSTNTALAAETIRREGAHVGICLDGDADRVMILDENGTVADGDQFMALLATRWSQRERLMGNTLVATVMSNLGLERYLNAHSIDLQRTGVGDRYVVEAMRRGGWNLGGEQSGHIVMTDYTTTGDGLIAGLQFLAAMVETGKSASDLASQFEPVPQMLKNVRYAEGQEPLLIASVQAAISQAEAQLLGTGRLLIRKSGTEPLIRVMAECEDEALLREVVNGIVAEVEAVASA
jgi:phosphoglucosamine mutase